MNKRPFVTIKNHTSTTQSLLIRQQTENFTNSIFTSAANESKAVQVKGLFAVELVPSDGNLIFSEQTRQLQDTLLSFAMRIFETTRQVIKPNNSISSVLVTTNTTTQPPTVSVRVTDAVNHYDISNKA